MARLAKLAKIMHLICPKPPGPGHWDHIANESFSYFVTKPSFPFEFQVLHYTAALLLCKAFDGYTPAESCGRNELIYSTRSKALPTMVRCRERSSV